jgi:hypothetical protein
MGLTGVLGVKLLAYTSWHEAEAGMRPTQAFSENETFPNA